jgi:hypothetical protein
MMMQRIIFFIVCFFIALTGFSQSVSSPSATSYTQNTANQVASGFSVNGFNVSATLLVTVGLVNPPSGTTLRFATTSGVSASVGYSIASNFTRISFTGTQSNINTVLASLRVNTGSIPGNVYIAVTATENPTGYFYLPSNGHFYRPIASGAYYSDAKAAAAATTFKGQQGYLVTITSADEDAFIYNNVPQSQIWFALSDVAQEGYWRIDAGPEAGTLIKTSNGQYAGNIAGQYNNWAGGEPNNSGGEHYAVTKWNGSQWNDLPNYFSCPYVIEYGTWTDPANQTFTNFYTGFVTHQISCSPATSPSAPVGVNGSRSLAGTVSLSATTTTGITVDWYANSTGGNVLSNGYGTLSYTTPNISATTTYYAQTRNISTGCVSSTRTPVTATVNYPTPFSYSGTFYNSQNIGIPNITVSVYYRLKTASSYSLLQTSTTNSLGTFSISTSLDISTYDFQIIIDNISIGNPILNDVNYFNVKILNQNFTSKDYYQINTNGNNILSISDIYLMHKKINGNLWPNGIPSYRIFTQFEWNIINSSNNNLIGTYPGAQSITLNNPTAGGSSVYYLIKTGHTN